MGSRNIAASLLLAAAGVTGVGLGLIVSAPWLMGIGLLLTVASGVLAVSGVLGEMVTQTASRSPAGSLKNRASGQALEVREPSKGRSSTTEVSGLFEPQSPDPTEVLNTFARNAATVGTVTAAHMWMLDEATETLRLVEAVGHKPPPNEPIRVGNDPIGDSIDRGVAVLVRASRQAGAGLPADSWRYILPLVSGPAKGAAVLDLDVAQPDQEALMAVAAHARSYLSASLAMYVSQTETAAAGALLQAVAEIIRLVDEQAILDATLTRALELSAAHTGSIMLVDEVSGLMRIRASQGLPEEVASQTAVSEGEGIAGLVLASGEPIVVESIEDRGPRSRRHGIRSAAAVPVADDEGVLGVLNVGSRTFHARFSSTHVSALESLGRVLALALRNARAHAASRDLYLETVKALALALETKDPYSKGATERILDLSTRLGTEVGLRGTELQGLRIAALVHDIGMEAAGDLHSLEDRPLSTVERGMLKLHPVIAADVLSQAPALRAAVPVVYHHHEHFDGAGYVQGLMGDDIPLGARVLAVADSYVAMTSPRAYRRAMSPDAALQELVDRSGSQYDPDIVSALSSVLAAERARA